MYHGAVRELAERVLAYIRRQGLLGAGDRVGVAVSGGADSVALLRLLLELRGELGIVLSVVHFNHQLRGAESEDDEKFVAELARAQGLELRQASGNVAAFAAEKRLSLEAAARELRYDYFKRLLAEGAVNRVATAHTLDDQAETVLLRLARGAGTRGLAGIYPQLPVASGRWPSVVGRQEGGGGRKDEGTIVRPLLSVRRKELEAYLAGLGQSWREDSSNRDLRHARNRVRHGVLPRLERNLNPAVREALAETADIARAEEEYWEQEVARVLPLAWQAAAGRRIPRTAGGVLKLAALRALPLAVQRRLVRAVGEALGLRLEFRQVEEILQVASGKPGTAKVAVLPGGWAVSRNPQEVRFERSPAKTKPSPKEYAYRLPVPGRVKVPEAGAVFEAVVTAQPPAGYNPEHLFERALLADDLVVRNWRAGDRFWPAHTKSPKKLKELLQERRVAQPERKLWPVVASGDDIVWVRGFPGPARLRPKETGKQAVLIRELPLAQGGGQEER